MSELVEPGSAEDGGPPLEGYERVLTEAEQLLDDVDGALVRIREGRYRTCEVCGGSIEDELLRAEPIRRRCLADTESH